MRAWAGVLVIGLAVGAAGGRPAPAQVEALIDVYQAGDGGYHTFRIPSLVAARSGTLLAFAEGRRLGDAATSTSSSSAAATAAARGRPCWAGIPT